MLIKLQIAMNIEVISLVILAGFLKSFALSENVGGRIVGGYNATDGQFPYTVSLRINNGNVGSELHSNISKSPSTLFHKYFHTEHFCGGSIIAPNWVLTTASCLVLSNVNTLQIVVGSIFLGSSGFLYSASKFYIHPMYNQISLQNDDIGLIEFRTAITFTSRIGAIALPAKNTPVGLPVRLNGWGYLTDNLPRVSSQRLQVLDVVTMSNSQCSRVHNIQFLDRQICTQNPLGKGICGGDAGGPLTTIPAGSQAPVLVGLDSLKRGCALGYPDIYTRVTSYTGWISAITGLEI